jgi:hypothetical protein
MTAHHAPTTRHQRCNRAPANLRTNRASCRLTWTRLGSGIGHTNTEAKRAEIHAALEGMAWRHQAELADERFRWRVEGWELDR